MSLNCRENSPAHGCFLEAPFNYNEARYVIIGVPYDSTSSWGVGSRFGPSAIIEASRYMDPYDIELDCIPLESGIHTMPELSVMGIAPTRMIDAVYSKVVCVLSDGKVPVILGGEHTVSLGAIKAAREFGVDYLVVLDAHADFYDEYEGERFSHATVTMRASEIVPRTLVMGVRTIGWEEKRLLSDREDVRVLYRESLGDQAISEIKKEVKGRKIYLSVDVDILDPCYVPCVSTPEPDGLSWRELTHILREIIHSSEVIAMDFVEFSPCHGMRSDSYSIARLVYKAIGYHATNPRNGNLGYNSDE